MSTLAPSAPAAARSAHRDQVRRVTGWLLSAHLYMALWFWGIVVVGLVVVGLVLAWGDGTSETAVSGVIVQPALWFSFSMGIALTVRQLGPHVAAGLTRRSFTAASLACGVVMAGVYALVLAALSAASGWVVDALGWDTLAATGLGGATSFPAVWGVSTLIVAAGGVTGLVVGLTYYRFGGLIGTLLLLVTVPPVIAVQLLLGAEPGEVVLAHWLDPVELRVGVSLVVVAIMAVVFRGLVRRVAVT